MGFGFAAAAALALLGVVLIAPAFRLRARLQHQLAELRGLIAGLAPQVAGAEDATV